jgi:hypothetical protein
MSHTAYDDLWLRGQVELADLLPVELPKDPPKPEKDKLVAFQKFATMYIKYILIFRKLEESYDQIVHPQKRRTIRHLLDGVIGRVLELKNEMVTLELLEFHYFDDILSDMKLTPVCIPPLLCCIVLILVVLYAAVHLLNAYGMYMPYICVYSMWPCIQYCVRCCAYITSLSLHTYICMYVYIFTYICVCVYS